MKRGSKLLLTLLITIMALSTVNFGSIASSVADEQIVWEDKFDVEADKKWAIKFNGDIDEEYVNSGYFYVLNENGEKHQTKLVLNYQNPDLVSIQPLANYTEGHTYSLHIQPGIKSLDGRIMNKSIVMNFHIKPNNTKADILQEKGPNGSRTVKLTISLTDNEDTPLTGYKADDFNVRIQQLSNWVYGFDNYYFSNFIEQKNGRYTVDFLGISHPYTNLINLKAKGDVIAEELLIELPVDIAEITNFPNDYIIDSMPNTIEGITNPDEGKHLGYGAIQIKYLNYGHEKDNYSLDMEGNWVRESTWLPVIDTSPNKDLSSFKLNLNAKQLAAINSSRNYEGNPKSYHMSFKGVYEDEHQEIVNFIKSFAFD